MEADGVVCLACCGPWRVSASGEKVLVYGWREADYCGPRGHDVGVRIDGGRVVRVAACRFCWECFLERFSVGRWGTVISARELAAYAPGRKSLTGKRLR